MDNIRIDKDLVTEIVKKARGLESTYQPQMLLFQRYREMYFLKNVERPKNNGVDEGDWKITADPSARNEVVGLKRLLDTSDIHVTVKSKGEDAEQSNKIEKALLRIVEVSGEGRKSRVETDAMLAAVLYGPVILSADAVSDLLSVPGIPKYKKRHLEKVSRKSPFLLRAHNPEDSYIDHDDGMVIHYHRRYSLYGAQVKARYGVTDVRDGTEYEVRDIFTPENHVVEVQGKVVFAAPHGLDCVPVATSYAGGSELFHKPEQQIQSFLYAKAESGLDKWGNSTLTAMRTAMHIRGLGGPMFSVDPDSTPETIQITHAGGVRIIRAKATNVDEKIIDPVIFQAKQLVDELSGQSTIYRQSVGENINTSTFSSLAMLSQSGKLPMIDAQRALEGAFRDIFDYMLYRIKMGGVETDLLIPSDIPDEYDIEVTFEPKLPQDNLRNAQVASSLGPLVSDEWKHTNLLQIGDSEDMRKQVAKEQIMQGMVTNLLQNPQMMQEMTAQIFGIKPPQPEQPTAPSQNGMMPPEGISPDGMMPPDMMRRQPNMEAMPQTDPMIPPQERM